MFPDPQTTPETTAPTDRSCHGAHATNGAVGGQAALTRQMRVDPGIRNRAVTGAVLWAVAAAIGALQQYRLQAGSMPHGGFSAYLGFTVLMATLCLVVGPRLPQAVFERAETFVVALGWLATAGLVAFTGGAASPDLALFANVFFYCAYFMEPRRAASQLLVGTAFLWAPVAYDLENVVADGFLARALVMTVVLWATALLIGRNRRLMLDAELAARRLALTDPLTGVANLHTFSAELGRALARAEDDDGRLGVAFVDVNGLKAANTVFGHSGGDELIRRTAQALLDASGADDQVARVGGDEFAVLVSGADAVRMKRFASDFAVALASHAGERAGPAFELSASIGTSVFPQDGDTLDDLMRVADERMYDSKAALPQRLPTPGTSGGRQLSEQSAADAPTRRFMAGDAPAAAIGWLIAAGLITAAAIFGDAPGHPRLALAIGALCVVVAGVLGLAGGRMRELAEPASNVLALVLAVPVIYATGGAATPMLPLAYLIVAHAAYALSVRAAALRIGAMLGILVAMLGVNVGADRFGEVSVIVGEALVLAILLRYNRMRMAAAQRKAIELSRIDALTKLANRRVFERTLTRVADTPPAGGRTAYDGGGLILADVDHFKAINTSGGHKAGDAVLQMIAAVLDGAVGREATVCRIGGDEFAVIVPSGDAADLMRTAAKCRAAIGAVDWNVLCEPNVTLSLGYASWQHVDSWKDIVIAADLALRASKEAGRDAVSVAPRDAFQVPRIGPGQDPDAAIAG